MIRRKVLALACLLCLVPVVGCNRKVETDPSAAAAFNSISARLSRVANIYAPAALDAIPFLAATLKWDEAKVQAVRTVVETKIRSSAESASRTLGKIADSAINASQKLAIGPLLTMIGDGLAELEQLGLFDSLENTKLEAGIKIAALALKTVGRLLPREVS